MDVESEKAFQVAMDSREAAGSRLLVSKRFEATRPRLVLEIGQFSCLPFSRLIAILRRDNRGSTSFLQRVILASRISAIETPRSGTGNGFFVVVFVFSSFGTANWPEFRRSKLRKSRRSFHSCEKGGWNRSRKFEVIVVTCNRFSGGPRRVADD